MTGLKVSTRLELGQAAWDAFVDSCDQAWLWHRFDLQDALATWPGRRDISFAVLEEGLPEKVLAVIPLQVVEYRELRFMRWIVIDSLGGPVYASGLGEKQGYRILKFIIEQVLTTARRTGAVEINLALSPMAPFFRGARAPRVNPLLSLGLANTLTQTWVLDLGRGEQQVWDGMEKRARTAVRKAEKSGVRIRPAKASEEDLAAYYELHRATYIRTGVAPHPRAYFEAIWRDFLARGFAYIFFAMYDGQVIAAENFGIYKNAAIYWTGAASALGLEFQASSLIQWSAIQKMLADGVLWYETGEAFPGATEGKSKGLNDFKRSFGGELFPLYRGQVITGKKRHALKQTYLLLKEAIRG